MRDARTGCRGLALAVALAAAASCGGEAPPAWIDLAAATVRGTLPAGELAPGTRLEHEQGEPWLVARLARGDWRAEEGAGRHRAGLPLLAVGHPRAGGAPYRLVAEGRVFEFEPDPARFGATPGRFTTNAARALSLELCLAPGEEPPEEAELWACVAYQEQAPGGLRVRGRRLSGAGFWVPSGHARTIELALPPEARLSFGTAVEPLLARKEERTAPHTFRVRLDGAVIFEQRREVGVLGEDLAWHALDLPRGGVRRARLAFEVEGPLALCAFLAPVVGPRAIGSYGARPHSAPRPDLVVFLADTFRADNLEAYGGTLGVTPEIDAFARAARTFARAWSTSTHTLPAHSSMFSGVYPHQNGQVDFDNPLPEAVETLAERLSASGYRCGLVSDGGMVSSTHGLDQGFASFDERREAGTLERAREFLAADDGRPLFLFVQTYAAHAPYAVAEATRARLAGTLRLERSFAELMATDLLRSEELLPLGAEAPPTDPEARAVARQLHDLYRAGVADLDALFGRFRAELERRGVLARGYLLFTSDHGESFFEHGRPFHTNWVYEEELRVPLVLAGPLALPGRDERQASLIDFAPTLAELAGLAPAAHWRGRSLLAPAAPRPLFAFQSRRGRPGSTLAVIDGSRKLIGYEDLEALRAGRAHAAFDLEQDPREQHSLLEHAAWPAELARRYRAELEELLTPLVEPAVVQRTPEQLEQLRFLGYGGEGGDE